MDNKEEIDKRVATIRERLKKTRTKTITISSVISLEDRVRLEMYATKQEVSISVLLKHIIEEWLERKEKFS